MFIKTFFEYLFSTVMPLKDAMYNDEHTIMLNIVGGLLIAVTFLIIGLICLVYAGRDKRLTSVRRRKLSQLIGLFLMTCASARIIDVVTIWHDFAIINGWIKILTGLFALMALMLIPGIIKEVDNDNELLEVKKKMDEAKKGIDRITEITEKITK